MYTKSDTVRQMYAASYTKCKQDRQCTYNNNIAARSRNCRRCATVRNITYSECVPVALVTQQATRMRHIILSSVACPALHFFTLPRKQCDAGKNVIEYKVCVLILSTAFVTS